ncbi:MAG TPA: hypothetical protein VNR00_14865 [Opitutus sp.]|nr:hypothetical protein [Opitutus sp.]
MRPCPPTIDITCPAYAFRWDLSVDRATLIRRVPDGTGSIEITRSCAVREVRAVFADREEPASCQQCETKLQLSWFTESSEDPLLGLLLRT